MNLVHEAGIDIHIHDEPAYPHRTTFPIHKETTDFDLLTDLQSDVKGFGDYKVGYQNATYDSINVQPKKGVEVEEETFWKDDQGKVKSTVMM